MARTGRRARLTLRLFALYAAISLVPVIVLGLVLGIALTGEAKQRGLAQGRHEAQLVAQTAIEPQLTGERFGHRLNPTERGRVQRIASRAIGQRHVLRLRLRSLAGRVVYSEDGSGFAEAPEDEALEAASGHVVARLTHLNADSNDSGASGVPAVEVYLPLMADTPPHRVGVLEVYLPYAPIGQEVSAGLHSLYLDLAVGLAVLYLVLFAITVSVSRGLRREAAFNAFLAQHDTLTELPNRTLFHRHARKVISQSERRGQPAVLAIVDLDRFKEINDTLGHQNGDVLLTELSRRLARAMRTGDTVARLGGDEFGLILRDVSDPEQALWRLRKEIEREVEISDLPLSIEASIGYVVVPHDGSDVDILLQHADVAMYAAKDGHLGVARYESSQDRFDAQRLSLVSELRSGIQSGQLILHYQPLATTDGGEVVTVEALVRWQHPLHGLLYPDRFLPLAEQTDVIDKLTAAVIHTAASQIASLGSDHDHLRVAVNVSARNLMRNTFAAEVLDTLAKAGLEPQRLIVEVTETALMVDPLGAAAILRQLAAAGVGISLDDFGRGQTSLAYLSALPLDELKIDRSFVSDMLENQADAAIVRAIIDLGHNLGLQVVAEGVETEEILAEVRFSGCDIAQGYLLARPMPFAQLSGWLTEFPGKVRRDLESMGA